MTELPFWQLAAGYIAVLLAFLGVSAFVRAKGTLAVVMVGALIAVPLVGFAAYAIVPGRTPDLDAMLVAWIPASIGLAGAAVLIAATAGRQPLTGPRLVAGTAGTILLWQGVVVALSIVLAQWQPAYGIANVVLNASWLIVWIPDQVRRLRGETMVEISAPRARVFDFLSQPSNWPKFDEDAVSVTVRPPGDLVLGSHIVEVSRYDAAVRGPRILSDTVETVLVVTAIVPGRSIITRAEGAASELEFAFDDSATGTLLTVRARVTVPYRFAIIGAIVFLRSQRSARAAKTRRNLARLKEILEQP